MRSGTADVADRKTRKIRRHSPSREEASDGGGLPLKKGPWTSAEDAILVEYVTKHGEGNWNAVQKHSGLARCGKSCRLRWANHLRPDLKKGAFSPEEERLIIELHAKMGNKWARMAAELPGRTDNEIKNYWNTRIKRLQRTGMPIYPSEVCLQVGGGIQESQDAGSMHAAVKNKSDLLQADDFEIPDVGFKKLEVDQGFSPLWSSFFEVPPFSAIREEICPSDHYGFPSMHPSKRIRESGVLLPVCNGASGNGIVSSFGPYCEYSPENISDPFVMSLPYDANPNSCDHSPFDVLPGSHAFVNGNNPSSEPHLGAMKSELPSLQYVETQQSSCDTPASPRPSFESVDPLIQSPPTEQFQSDCPSPRSSGLLEAVIYEACTLKGPRKNSFEEIKDVNGNVACNSCPTPVKSEQEVFTYSDSPLGHHAASVFSECTPVSGSSFDEPLSVGPMLGCNIQARENSEPFSGIVQRQEILDHIEFCRPDALLDFGWFGHDGQPSKDVITRADYAGPLDGDSNGGQPANQML